jgi:hypothetical protein
MNTRTHCGLLLINDIIFGWLINAIFFFYEQFSQLLSNAFFFFLHLI